MYLSALTSFGNLSAAYDASHPVPSETSSCLPNPVEQKLVDIMEGYVDGKLLNCFHCTVMVHIHRILHFHTLHFLSVETSLQSFWCRIVFQSGHRVAHSCEDSLIVDFLVWFCNTKKDLQKDNKAGFN